MVSKELLQELKTIIEEEYNEDLSDEQAHLIGNGMTRYFDLLARLIHNKQNDETPRN